MPKVADLVCGKPGDKHLSHHIPRGKSEIRVVTSRVKEKIPTHKWFYWPNSKYKSDTRVCVVIAHV